MCRAAQNAGLTPRGIRIIRVLLDEAGTARLEGVERALVRSRAKLAYDSVRPGDLPALQPVHQRRIWERMTPGDGPARLAQVIGDLRKILLLARLQQLRAPGRLEHSLAEHMALFAALKRRDPEAAESAMRDHLLRQRDALRDIARNLQSRIAP